MNSVRWIIVFIAMLVGGCSTAPKTSIGLYSDVAGPQKVKGSASQAMIKRTFPYTADEVMDASETALFRKGLNVEEKNTKKGKITALGTFQEMCAAGPCGIDVSVAVYVKQTSPKPTTDFTLLVDRQTFLTGWGGGDEAIAKKVVTAIQQILTTYK